MALWIIIPGINLSCAKSWYNIWFITSSVITASRLDLAENFFAIAWGMPPRKLFISVTLSLHNVIKVRQDKHTVKEKKFLVLIHCVMCLTANFCNTVTYVHAPLVWFQLLRTGAGAKAQVTFLISNCLFSLYSCNNGVTCALSAKEINKSKGPQQKGAQGIF